MLPGKRSISHRGVDKHKLSVSVETRQFSVGKFVPLIISKQKGVNDQTERKKERSYNLFGDPFV